MIVFPQTGRIIRLQASETSRSVIGAKASPLHFIRANSYKLKIYLPTVSPDKAENLVAAIIAAFCDMLVQLDREDKASNIDIVITGYKMILNVLTVELSLNNIPDFNHFSLITSQEI